MDEGGLLSLLVELGRDSSLPGAKSGDGGSVDIDSHVVPTPTRDGDPLAEAGAAACAETKEAPTVAMDWGRYSLLLDFAADTLDAAEIGNPAPHTTSVDVQTPPSDQACETAAEGGVEGQVAATEEAAPLRVDPPHPSAVAIIVPHADESTIPAAAKPAAANATAVAAAATATLTVSAQNLALAATRRFARLAASYVARARAVVQPYTDTVSGCAAETALFLTDRTRLLADKYVRAIASDDPEVRHMQRMLLAREAVWGWVHQQSCFLVTLPWRLRRLLRETRELDEAIEEALAVSERGRKAADEAAANNLELEQGPRAGSADGHAVVDLALPPAKEGEVGLAGFHHWLLGLASAGDEEAQYAVTRWFTPPPFQEADRCQHPSCGVVFGATTGLFRHHCRHCGVSFCTEHSSQRRALLRFGLGALSPVRVCDRCAADADALARNDLLQWRRMRVHAFLGDALIPYTDSGVDRGIDKALRVADGTLSVIKNTVSLNYSTKLVLNTVDVLKRYGLSGLAGVLMRRDFMEAVETLKRISGMDKIFAMSLHELTACTYYKLAIDRGLRGCDPDGEARDHAHVGVPLIARASATAAGEEKVAEPAPPDGQPSMDNTNVSGSDSGGGDSCAEVSDADIDEAVRLAPLALSAVYEESAAECQRVAATQGWTTVFVQSEAGFEQPAYALFSSAAMMEAVLAVRGTASVQDIVTDIRAEPQHFPPSERALAEAVDWEGAGGRPATASCGTAAAAAAAAAGVAGAACKSAAATARAMAGALWGRERPAAHHGGEVEEGDWVFVEGGATYACGGMARAALWLLEEVGPSLLALERQGYRVSLTGHSLGGACAALLCLLLRRAATAGLFVPPADPDRFVALAFGCPSCVDETLAAEMRPYVTTVVLHDDVIPRITPQSIRGLMRELMVFRAQVFRHLRQDWADVIERAASVWSPRTRAKDGAPPADAPAVSAPAPAAGSDSSNSAAGGMDADGELLADVEGSEAGLWPLWLPGRVLHLYSYRGVYVAAEVPAAFPTLRRIEVQGHIFANHRSADTFDALLEVRAVRAAAAIAIATGRADVEAKRAGSHLPVWTSYRATDVCECCRAQFTWHSTFKGEAQEYRERYNCRQCGGLVCEPCSAQRRAIPRIGLLSPQRVCDRCFHKGDYAHM